MLLESSSLDADACSQSNSSLTVKYAHEMEQLTEWRWSVGGAMA